MGERTLDKIRNGAFERGSRAPTGWTIRADDPAASWRLDADRAGSRTVRLQSHGDDAVAAISQRFRCRSSQWYRIDVAVCEAARSASTAGRLSLSVENFDADHACIATHLRPGPADCSTPVTWREYIQTPEGARTMSLAVQWSGGAGHARIGRVRCIPLDDLEIESHPLAVPPPARAYPPPRTVQRVVVVGESAPAAMLGALQSRFGRNHVAHVRQAPSKFAGGRADGIVFVGDGLPRELGSLRALLGYAAERIVVISPQQFAHIAAAQSGDRPAVRVVRQGAEPICAKVRDANFVTRGFALLDTFPYARYTEPAGEFEITALQRSRTLRVLLEAAGFVTTLVTEAAMDATSELPLCLVRPTARGAIVVLDVSPFESAAATDDVPNLAALLLFNALGQWQSASGQFVTPQRDRRKFDMNLDSFCERFPALEAVRPPAGGTGSEAMRVKFSAREETFGLPSRRRPLLRIRTRLTDRDWLGCYATLLWLKSLLRPAPWTAPHVGPLLAHYEIDWRPAATASAGHASAACEDQTPALLIDVAAGRHMAARVIVPADDRPFHRRLEDALPRLARELLPPAPTLHRAADGREPGERVTFGWHSAWPPVAVVRCESAGEPRHDAVRIELPAVSDGVANSIWVTELAMFLLEATAGLHAGMLAVNRTAAPRSITVPDWTAGSPRSFLRSCDVAPAPNAVGGDEPGTVELAPGMSLLIVAAPDAAPQRESALHFVSGKVAS